MHSAFAWEPYSSHVHNGEYLQVEMSIVIRNYMVGHANVASYVPCHDEIMTLPTRALNLDY